MPLYAIIQQPQRGGGAGAHDRRHEHHERAVHDRRGRGHGGAARGRALDTRHLCLILGDPQRRGGAVDLPAVAAGHAADAGARSCCGWLYRVEVRGLEHLAAAGERVVIVPNHVSYLDGPLIAAFLPGYPMFAIDTAQAAQWWVRPLLAGADIFPMDPTRPMATKSLIRRCAKAAMRDLSRGPAQRHRRRADESL